MVDSTNLRWLSFAGLSILGVSVAPSFASPILTNPSFYANTLPADDDGSTGAVSLGFSPNFFGTTYSNVYVNNNGNITFDGTQSTYTPYNLYTAGVPIIAPFFADVDTRGAGSGVTQYGYGAGVVNGHNAFAADWINVGYYGEQTDKLDSFQVVLIDRSDIGPGDFDIEFNYGSIQWETGQASGGTDGLGGYSARVGYSDGSSADSYEFSGSGVPGTFLDSNTADGLIYNTNDGVPGQYVFEVINGSAYVPEPASLGPVGVAAVGLLARRRTRKLGE